MLEEEERERHKLDRQIVSEEHWVRYGVTARRKRNMRPPGAARATCGRSAASAPRSIGDVKMTVTEGEHLGQARDRSREASQELTATARS